MWPSSVEERVRLIFLFWNVLECIHCRNSTTQDFIHWENVFTVAILQHNVPGFIHCKCGKSLLLRVYLHCDSLIELVLVKLHSKPFEFKDGCNYYIVSSMVDANIIYIWAWVTLWHRYLSERTCRILFSCISTDIRMRERAEYIW